MTKTRAIHGLMPLLIRGRIRKGQEKIADNTVSLLQCRYRSTYFSTVIEADFLKQKISYTETSQSHNLTIPEIGPRYIIGSLRGESSLTCDRVKADILNGGEYRAPCLAQATLYQE